QRASRHVPPSHAAGGGSVCPLGSVTCSRPRIGQDPVDATRFGAQTERRHAAGGRCCSPTDALARTLFRELEKRLWLAVSPRALNELHNRGYDSHGTHGKHSGARPLRVCLVGPSRNILGGQAVQLERLLAGLRELPSVEVGFIAVNPRLTGIVGLMQG